MEDRENWEKDFNGYQSLKTISRKELEAYLKAGEKVGIKLKYKKMLPTNLLELWIPKDKDLTLLWKELNLF